MWYLSPGSRRTARDLGGLVGIEPALRVAGLDRAEAAAARADVAHQHDGGSPAGPALAEVGAAGFLADGVEAALAEGLAQVGDGLPGGQAHLQPRRLRAGSRGSGLEDGKGWESHWKGNSTGLGGSIFSRTAEVSGKHFRQNLYERAKQPTVISLTLLNLRLIADRRCEDAPSLPGRDCLSSRCR
jgi:hypothetical protein